MCPRCHGCLLRDLGFQHITRDGVAYRCLNCGNYIDHLILSNRTMVQPERKRYEINRVTPYIVGDDTYRVFGDGRVLLGSSSLFSEL